MGPKTLPTIWVPIWSLWPNIRFLPSIVAEKNATKNEHIHCMFNVYKNQQSRQTESRNLTGPKTLPTIWYTYMMLVTKYQISAINSYWEKCDEKFLGRTEGQTEGRTDRGKTVYSPPPSGSGGINIWPRLWTRTQLFLCFILEDFFFLCKVRRYQDMIKSNK